MNHPPCRLALVSDSEALQVSRYAGFGGQCWAIEGCVGWGDNSVNKLLPEHTHFIDFESESIKLKESISQPI